MALTDDKDINYNYFGRKITPIMHYFGRNNIFIKLIKRDETNNRDSRRNRVRGICRILQKDN